MSSFLFPAGAGKKERNEGNAMFDINKPVTNPELVEAMAAAAADNRAETRSAMIEAMMEAHLLSPVSIDPPPVTAEDGTTSFQAGTKIAYPVLETQDGRQFLPAFTDWEELRKWQNNAGQQTIISTFDDLAGMVLNPDSFAVGFVLNPFGQNVTFDRELIASLKEQKALREQGISQQQVEKETPVRLGQPKDYPQAMVEAVRAHLAERPEVRGAWLQLMEKEGEESYLMVVDFTGDVSEVFGGIAQAARSHLKGMCLDMVPLDTPFGRDATENVAPFFQK